MWPPSPGILSVQLLSVWAIGAFAPKKPVMMLNYNIRNDLFKAGIVLDDRRLRNEWFANKLQALSRLDEENAPVRMARS